jgi:hypothetical protein
MTDFEYFFTFFGLLLGLTVVEVTVKLADAIDAHRRRPMGVLTPLLALFVLLDISSFWMFAWSARDIIQINWSTLLVALFMAVVYFLSAALIFPRSDGEWTTLDEHFWARRRLVLSGLIVVNLTLLALQLSRTLPALNDYWFFFYQAIYYAPLLWMWFARSRRMVIVALLCGVGGYLLAYSDLLPTSQWGDNLGLNGAAAIADPASALR